MSDEKFGISRREFVQAGSAAAALAPALSLAGQAFGSQVTSEIRCAVIGTGGRGRGRGACIRSLGRKAFFDFEERVVTWEDLLREDAPIRRLADRATA